jgi:pimeloyl-ACP methyl ester carboxylesterase
MKQVIIILTLAIGIFTSCQKEDFTRSGMANDHFFLQNNNQNMPVLVAGNLDSKKMILVIHGGPGGNSFLYREKYVRNNVEPEFAMVYWDQRFAGMTQGNGGSINVNTFRDDLKKLIQLLKAEYGSDQKIYLFAHSWGGFLAPYFLLDGLNEQMVKGWMQVDGAHNYLLNDSLTKQVLLFYGNQELNVGRNADFWKEVIDWCENNDFRGQESSVKLNTYAYKAESMFDVTKGNSSEIFSNNLSIGSVFSNSLSSDLYKIYLQAYDHLNSENLHRLTLPILLLWGKYDFVCPTGLAEDIETHVKSMDVHKVIFEHSGHNVMFNESELFWSEVIDWMRNH